MGCLNATQRVLIHHDGVLECEWALCPIIIIIMYTLAWRSSSDNPWDLPLFRTCTVGLPWSPHSGFSRSLGKSLFRRTSESSPLFPAGWAVGCHPGGPREKSRQVSYAHTNFSSRSLMPYATLSNHTPYCNTRADTRTFIVGKRTCLCKYIASKWTFNEETRRLSLLIT